MTAPTISALEGQHDLPKDVFLQNDAKTIAIVSTAHGLSHFFHLILAPLFPWLKDAFQVSYIELGVLMTVFFVVSSIGQATLGIVVDRIGPRPVMLASIAGFVFAALWLSAAQNYAMLIVGAAVAGLSNSVFHPVDFSILNARVSPKRLGYAFTAHGLSGNLGWALATGLLAGAAHLLGWRMALLMAAGLAAVVWCIVWLGRAHIEVKPQPVVKHQSTLKGQTAGSDQTLAFLKHPAVWLCFGFFCFATMALSGFQTFGSTLLKNHYGFSAALAGQIVTLFLLCGAIGMVVGGWLVTKMPRNDTQIALAYGLSALGAALIAAGWVPSGMALFFIALMGFSYGLAGPSRDMLIKRTTPRGATGRVYGMVYSGADVGFSVSPLLCGYLVDHNFNLGVFWALALFQTLAIFCAFTVGMINQRQVSP